MATLRHSFAGQHFPSAHDSLGKFGAPLPMIRRTKPSIDSKTGPPPGEFANLTVRLDGRALASSYVEVA